jgi:hypothetical protein
VAGRPDGAKRDIKANSAELKLELGLSLAKVLEVRQKYGMDVGSQKCKKCDFVLHSEGLLRKHRFQNHVLGFEIDLQKHIEVPQNMDDEV